MIDHPFFQDALPVLRKIEAAGFEAYFVGGAVRDLVLGRPVQDVDIATSALPAEVKEIFPRTVDVGIEHGTVLVLEKGTGFEVTTFRTESAYTDFRRPDEVRFVRSLREDLQRRDFTMNAMAVGTSGQWIDPFNGREDIQNRRIRTVGQASDRFAEDALRMLRAVRFVSQLSFRLDNETKKAIRRQCHLLAHIAVERKANELDKLLEGPDKLQAIQALVETGLHEFLPGLANQSSRLLMLADRAVFLLSKEQMWAAVSFLCAGTESKAFLKDWRFSQKRTRHVEQTVRTIAALQKSPADDWFLYKTGREVMTDAEAVSAVLAGRAPDPESVQARWEALPLKSRQELAVTGNDLLKWSSAARGPWIKHTLEKTEQAVVEKKVPNNRQDIERWLRACNLL